MELERKLLAVGSVDLKFDTERGEFEGYASVFNGLDSYGDRIEPGAFARTLESRERPIQMRFNHFGPVIGKWTDLHEDEKGLYAKGALTPGHSVAEDVRASLRHGAFNGLSIGFFLRDFDYDGHVRVIRDAELVEISVVEEPADNDARIASVKAAVEAAGTFGEIESALRDAGLSRSAACAVVVRCKALTQSDSASKTSKAILEVLRDRL